MFSKRQTELIKFIMNNPQGVFGSRIAETFYLSSRTIRSEIKEINDREDIISSSKKKGYFIAVEQMEKVRQLIYKQQSGQKNDNTEKRVFILLGILSFRESADLYDLGDELHFSDQTIKSDVGKLQKMIVQMNIPIKVVSFNNRITLEYEERAIRKLYNKIFIKYTCLHGSTILRELLYDYFDDKEYEALFQLLRRYFKHTDIFLTDDELMMIADAIYTSIVRNNNNYLIKTRGETFIFPKEVEKLLQFILDSRWNITLNDYESLGRFLSTMKITKDTSEEISNFTLFVFDELCAEALDKYCLDLKTTEEFIGKFLVHLEYMIRRAESNEQISNPLLKDIKREFTYAYEISMLLVPICYKYMSQYISDDEIAFITLYIAHYMETIYEKLNVVLIVSSRKSLVNITENWLDRYFYHSIQVVNKLPAYLLEEYLESQKVDLIVTTTENMIHPKIPIFSLTGIPSNSDETALNSLIKGLRETIRYKSIVRKVFQEDMVKFYKEEATFQKVIEQLSEIMEQKGKIKNGHAFAKDVLNREEKYSTHLNEFFMIPHPLDSFAEKSSVAAAILEKPLRIHGQCIKIIFVVAIERKQDSDISMLFEFFQSLSGDKEAMHRIMNMTSEEEFVSFMMEMTSLMD